MFTPWSKKKVSIATLFAILIATIAVPAFAHVKWFVKFDISKPLLPIDQVLTRTFILFLLASVVCNYVFFVVDRYMYKNKFLLAFDQRLKLFDGFSIVIMRVCASIFFISLWILGLQNGSSFYLTPELSTKMAIVPWIHLVLGLSTMLSITTPITGVGILVLYALGIDDFGAFHMADYMIFLGIAYFFIVSNVKTGQWKKSGFIVLFASSGLTLIWAAVEKFGYPQWTYPMLANNPGMLMGMEPYVYMVLAGFVEFNVTFILLGAASVIGRLVALGLEFVFLLAIAKFGLIDAIGHLMIIATLFVLIVRGPTDAREMLVLRDKTIWTEAYFMTGLYFLAFNMIFILYYGLHFMAYGR